MPPRMYSEKSFAIRDLSLQGFSTDPLTGELVIHTPPWIAKKLEVRADYVWMVLKKNGLPTNKIPSVKGVAGLKLRKSIVQAIESDHSQEDLVSLFRIAYPLIKRIYDEECAHRHRQPGKKAP